MNTPRSLLLGAALLAAPAALAQQHGGMDHSQMDHSQMEGMDHAGMDHDAMMALHHRMMADPEVHAAMQADPEMKALMAEMMPPMDHSKMEGMDHSGMTHEMPMDADARAAMMAQMRERMQAMSPEEHAAFMARMEAAHLRLMATPAVHQRMMADPEMRQMMEAMPGGMPGMDHGSMQGMDHSQMQGMDPSQMQGMDHSQMQGMDHSKMEGMDHSGTAGESMQGMDHGSMSGMNHSGAAGGAMPGMDHSQMAGMDHSQMSSADHAAGVALQRRNAGASNGDEREESSPVGPAAFEASATADRFHAALAAGDREAMEALLAPDAVVLEGGNHESRAEYLSHHFARDVQALAGTTPESIYRRTGVAGDAAWVASTQRVGNAETAELLVMKQTPDGWRVAAVHWSSARN